MIVCGCNLFEWGTFLRRMDNFLMDLVAEPDRVIALLEASMGSSIFGTLERVCEAVGDVVDIIRFGDDLGMIGGPFMSPQTYRTTFKPHHARLNAYVHQHTPMKTFLHSCGSIYALLGDLIEAGYDIINPVQTNCKDMDPARLKREFGNDIAFWGGGCDTAAVLGRADPGRGATTRARTFNVPGRRFRVQYDSQYPAGRCRREISRRHSKPSGSSMTRKGVAASSAAWGWFGREDHPQGFV